MSKKRTKEENEMPKLSKNHDTTESTVESVIRRLRDLADSVTARAVGISNASPAKASMIGVIDASMISVSDLPDFIDQCMELTEVIVEAIHVAGLLQEALRRKYRHQYKRKQMVDSGQIK